MLCSMRRAIVVISGLAWMLLGGFFASAATPLSGTVIALDPGHGGSDTGAVNPRSDGVIVMEKDVNLKVAYALKKKLEADGAGAKVILTREVDETISSRKERVAIAGEKCKDVADGRTCDILISLHHNGSSNSTVDGTMILYGNRDDEQLAFAMHEALVLLTDTDLGYDKGGWGISVHAKFPAVITESYFITNDVEAEAYLAGTRVDEEVVAQYSGIVEYFSSTGGGDGGDDGKGGGPPDHARNNK